jgi:spermidine synthase
LGFGIYPDLLLYLLFFLSGISGLIYQVVWVRVFGNVFGNTVYSASLVVAVFMLGLGVGSYGAGRWADRRYASHPGQPLRAYGYFEIAIAVLGAAIALALPHLDRLSAIVTAYRQDANGWYVITTASYAARVAIAVGLLTPITLLMGGTLTLLIRYLVRSEVEAQSRRIALLYAVNTAGAAAGCFLTDFALVPAWGLLRTQLLAVALNMIAGAGAIMLGRLKPAPTIHKSQIPNPKTQTPKKASRRTANLEPRTPNHRDLIGPVAIALALSGFAGLGMEILWFRHFSIMLGAFRAVFSLLLTVILIGIGAGSLAAGVVQRRRNAGLAWLAVQSLFIVATLAGMWAANSSPIDQTVSNAISANASHPSVLAELWFNLRPMLPEVALPALLIGFSFPLANAVVQRVEESVGRRAGVLYLANTAGAVCGSLVCGFILLPLFGLQISTTVLMTVAAVGLIPLYYVVRLKPDATNPVATNPVATNPVVSAFRRTLPPGNASDSIWATRSRIAASIRSSRVSICCQRIQGSGSRSRARIRARCRSIARCARWDASRTSPACSHPSTSSSTSTASRCSISPPSKRPRQESRCCCTASAATARSSGWAPDASCCAICSRERLRKGCCGWR